MSFIRHRRATSPNKFECRNYDSKKNFFDTSAVEAVIKLVMLFLGGKESSTLKEISETLGKETIDLYNTSDTRGQSPSFGTTYQKTGKELMSRDELSVMDGSKCILQLRGVRPFLSDKFDITKHKRYKELSDFDKKNAFDVERYLKHELRLRMDEEFDCYEVDVSEESTA